MRSNACWAFPSFVLFFLFVYVTVVRECWIRRDGGWRKRDAKRHLMEKAGLDFPVSFIATGTAGIELGVKNGIPPYVFPLVCSY